MPEPEEELKAKVTDLATSVASIKVVDTSSYALAAEGLKAVKALRTEIETFFKPLKQKAHEAHKAITQAEKSKLDPLLSAEAAIKYAMLGYEAAQATIRREQERKLTEEARKRAEEHALLDAIDLEEAGDTEAATALLDKPVLAPVVSIASPMPKVDGISYRETWKATITDLKALCRAVADGTVPPMAITPNVAWLDGQARALRTALNYPGVEAYSEKIVASR